MHVPDATSRFASFSYLARFDFSAFSEAAAELAGALRLLPTLTGASDVAAVDAGAAADDAATALVAGTGGVLDFDTALAALEAATVLTGEGFAGTALVAPGPGTGFALLTDGAADDEAAGLAGVVVLATGLAFATAAGVPATAEAGAEPDTFTGAAAGLAGAIAFAGTAGLACATGLAGAVLGVLAVPVGLACAMGLTGGGAVADVDVFDLATVGAAGLGGTVGLAAGLAPGVDAFTFGAAVAGGCPTAGTLAGTAGLPMDACGAGAAGRFAARGF